VRHGPLVQLIGDADESRKNQRDEQVSRAPGPAPGHRRKKTQDPVHDKVCELIHGQGRVERGNVALPAYEQDNAGPGHGRDICQYRLNLNPLVCQPER